MPPATRRGWVPRAVTLGLVAVGLRAASACSDEGAPGDQTFDAGDELLPVAPGICPEAAPDAGLACTLPEGTTCAFGACGSPIATCTRGLWRYAANPPPVAICPDPEPPPAESACPPCWPANVSCVYGSCTGPDASTNAAIASCPSGTWTLRVTPCNPDAGEVEGGPGDAGADVQRDADADAD